MVKIKPLNKKKPMIKYLKKPTAQLQQFYIKNS